MDKESDRHVDLLMSIEPFIVEAETLYLLEIESRRLRRHIECRVPDDRLIGEVLGREEYELLFAEMDLHLALHRLEPPRQIQCNVGIQPNRDNALRDVPGFAFSRL